MEILFTQFTVTGYSGDKVTANTSSIYIRKFLNIIILDLGSTKTWHEYRHKYS